MFNNIKIDYEELYYGDSISETQFQKLSLNLLNLSDPKTIELLKKEIDQKYKHHLLDAPKKQSEVIVFFLEQIKFTG